MKIMANLNKLTRDELIKELVSVKVGGKLVNDFYEISGIDKKELGSMVIPHQKAIQAFISNSKAVIYVRKG